MSFQCNAAIEKHIKDTLVHKQFFISSCLKMIEYLHRNERHADALALAKRCSLHDHSKLENDEVEMFSRLPCKKDEKPNGVLTPEQKLLICTHWSRNRHHPEFFDSYKDMKEIDILEMVCDWHARSQQFQTDFMEFVMTVPRTRFGFDDEFFERVLKYCDVLLH